MDQPQSGGRSVTYCLVPYELAAKLHEPLRRHFRDDRRVEVIVEGRRGERRRGTDRRQVPAEPEGERRAVRSPEGRRIGERRASLFPVEAPELPRRLRRYAGSLVFVERVEPPSIRLEELDTARAVVRFQRGDRDAFAVIYMRYFDRVYGYLRVVFKDVHEAEDLTQQVFIQALEALPRYEQRRKPFSAWLFTIVRNLALMQFRKQGRVELADPVEMDVRREPPDESAGDQPVLDWISDRDLYFLVERLPLEQRQVLLLRYMFGLRGPEIADILGRSPEAVRQQQARALAYLRRRLTALGRDPRRPTRGDRARMKQCLRQANVLRSRRYALMLKSR